MAVHQGRDLQIGVVDEVTYGTPVTVTRFFEGSSESVQRQVEHIVSETMRKGRFNEARTGAYQVWDKGAEGSFTVDVSDRGFAWFLKHMMGAVQTTGAGPAYEHTGSVASLVGDFFTLQEGRGTQAFTYAGCKINSWELSLAVGEMAHLEFTIDSRSESTAIALASASYPASLAYLSFLQATIEIDSVATNVTGATISCENNLATELYYIRSSGQKDEPVDQNRTFTGTVDKHFEDLTLYNKFVSGATASLNVLFTGGVISGGDNYEFEVNIPAITFTGETPTVGGPDIIGQSLPFKILNDDFTIRIKNGDSAP